MRPIDYKTSRVDSSAVSAGTQAVALQAQGMNNFVDALYKYGDMLQAARDRKKADDLADEKNSIEAGKLTEQIRSNMENEAIARQKLKNDKAFQDRASNLNITSSTITPPTTNSSEFPQDFIIKDKEENPPTQGGVSVNNGAEKIQDFNRNGVEMMGNAQDLTPVGSSKFGVSGSESGSANTLIIKGVKGQNISVPINPNGLQFRNYGVSDALNSNK